MGFLVSNLILVCTRAVGPLPHIPMVCGGLPIRAGWHTGPLSRISAPGEELKSSTTYSSRSTNRAWAVIIYYRDPPTVYNLYLYNCKLNF